MKHILNKVHWPHIRRRVMLEFFGLALLMLLVIRERDLIEESISSIRESDLLYIIIGLAVYWLLLPMTALSYKLLCHKKIPIFSTTLAHLAGSGPGRIIPGGLGHMSMAVFHLKELGVQLHKAIVVVISNNIVGIAINVVVFSFVLINRESIRNSITSTLSADGIVLFAFMTLALIVLVVWLMHFRKIRNSVLKVERQFIKTLRFLLNNPRKLFGVFLIAFIILLGSVLILLLSGDALQVAINPSDAVIALSIGVLIGGLLPTPGGLGGVEAGIAATLTMLGYPAQDAVSVALLYRFITYWQPLIPGTLAYFYLRERKLI